MISLEVGDYSGDFCDNMPHGEGSLIYKYDDPMGRHKYEGGWKHGLQEGEGKVTFKSGDEYEGGFKDGAPHGKGTFRYINGDLETATWENGVKQGLSVYTSEENVEEITFREGMAEGPSKLTNKADGSVEERVFVGDLKSGKSTRTFPNGDKYEYEYVNNEISGPAVIELASGIKEECIYDGGVKHGPSIEFKDGLREERNYDQGVLQGEAVSYGPNGDKMTFSYKNGVRNGQAVYRWADGTVEVSLYDETGSQNGPAKLTWPNGAEREGHKKNGKWHGEVLYTFADGGRKGRKDVEMWQDGEMQSSQKFYGQGEKFQVEDWEDLKKMTK